MEQYIPKSALVAEIDRLRKNQRLDDRHSQGVIDGLHAIEKFIERFEVKEVDLENEIEKCLKQYNMLAVGKKDFTDIAKHFFELGMAVSNKAQKGE